MKVRVFCKSDCTWSRTLDESDVDRPLPSIAGDVAARHQSRCGSDVGVNYQIPLLDTPRVET